MTLVRNVLAALRKKPVRYPNRKLKCYECGLEIIYFNYPDKQAKAAILKDGWVQDIVEQRTSPERSVLPNGSIIGRGHGYLAFAVLYCKSCATGKMEP